VVVLAVLASADPAMEPEKASVRASVGADQEGNLANQSRRIQHRGTR